MQVILSCLLLKNKDSLNNTTTYKMDSNISKEKKPKLRKAAHIVAGMIILFHAFEKYESGQSSYLFFVIAGIIFLSIAIFHHSLKLKYPWIDNCFFIIEAILSLVIAYDYFHMGKKGLPVMYLFAGLLQLCAIYFFSRRLKKQPAHLQTPENINMQ